MPYINFKEEVTVAKQQLENRIKNNEKLIKHITKDKSILTIVPDEKYSFRTIEERTINTSKTETEEEFLEISNKNIVCTKFINCKFYNIKFTGCNFIGCNFKECDFGGGGVIFENCSFLEEELKNVPSLNKKDNLSCIFEKCKIYIKFSSCNISYLIFDKCDFKDTAFELTDMTDVIIINSNMKNINIVDVDLSGAKIVGTYIENFEFNDKLKSKLDEKSFIDKIVPRKKTKAEYEGIYKVYETIADKFKENTLDNNFGEYYFLSKNMQRRSLDKIETKISSYIYWFTCGYGERILYPLLTSLVLIVIFAIIYLIIGIRVDEDMIRYALGVGMPKTIMEFISHFNEALNLSVGMFAGLGINNSQPVHAAYMVSNLEMVLGVIMMGVGIGTLTRKLIR